MLIDIKMLLYKGHSGHLITGMIVSGEVREAGEKKWKRYNLPIKSKYIVIFKIYKDCCIIVTENSILYNNKTDNIQETTKKK